MESYINVIGNGQKTVEVVAQPTGVINEDTLRKAFLLESDVVIGLFRNGRALSYDGSVFHLQNDWIGATFELTWEEARRSRPATPMDQERPLTPMNFKRVERIQKVINEWEDRVFMINGEKGSQGSGVLISDQNILTAAHLSFKLHESYNIRGTNNRCFSAKCEFISKDYDFAMLKSTDLSEFGTPTDQLNRGNKYLMMGYPNGITSSKPSITKGIIEGMMDDHIHLVGTPGSKRGYSGAPVFNYFGYLTGILLGGTSCLTIDTTIRECTDSSAEQKYARILGISSVILRYNQGCSNNES